MTPADIRARATLNRNCGLGKDADMIDALADLIEPAKQHRDNDPKLDAVLERIEDMDFDN